MRSRSDYAYMSRYAVSNFYKRIAHCQIVNGAQFEHFI